MAVTTSPFFNIQYGWTTGQDGWGDPVNTNLKVLSFLDKGAVDDFVSSLPGSPVTGSSYVLTTDNLLYVRFAEGWMFITPQNGMEVTKLSDGTKKQWNGSAWIDVTKVKVSDLAATTGSSLVGVNPVYGINRYVTDMLPHSIKFSNYLQPSEVTDCQSATPSGDYTTQLQTALIDAATKKAPLDLQGLNIRFTGTIIVNGRWSNIVKGNGAKLIFANTVIDKVALKLSEVSTFSHFEEINFVDTTPGTSTGLAIFGDTNGTPDWKNAFHRCRWDNFKTGVQFTSNFTSVAANQNFASETLFLHCKIKNCRTGVINDNLQALNNTFLQTDIENDDSGEQYTMILYRNGGGMYFKGCSLIGKGKLLSVDSSSGAALFNSGHILFEQCRMELRSPHNGTVIEQTTTSDLTGATSMKVGMKQIYVMGFSQTVDWLKVCGRINVDLDDVYINSGSGLIRTFAVNGKSGATASGSQGSIRVRSCPQITWAEGSTSDFGTITRRTPIAVDIANAGASTTGSYTIDSLGFYSQRAPDQRQIAYGLQSLQTSKMVFADPLETSGFSSVKFIMPLGAKLLKFGLWKQPIISTAPMVVTLYAVKDNSSWVDPANFNAATDAYVIATIPSTANQFGLFEVNIAHNNTVFGNRADVGYATGMTERRFYVEKTGTSFVIEGFVYVEYI